MVDDGKYGIFAFTRRKTHDQVHCNLLEEESVLFCRDPIEGSFPPVGEDLILLAGGASLDIVCDPAVHSIPWGMLFCLADGLVPSGVSHGVVIMNQGH